MSFGLDRLTDYFPALRVEMSSKCSFEIFGDIHVNASWGGFIVDELFSIRISAKNFPALPPECVETSGKNTTYHINPKKDLCLAAPRTLHEEITANPNIIFYINKFIIPFFFSFRYHQEHGTSPFGELEHGGKGLLPKYREIFKTSDIAICILLTYGTKFLYRGHHTCPCGSGMVLRKCHGPKLRFMFENYHPALLCTDLENCMHAKMHGYEAEELFFTKRYATALKKITRLIKGHGKV